MVRLLLVDDLEEPYRTLVSIPQWCDCCRKDFTSQKQIWQGFNPTMVRLLLGLGQEYNFFLTVSIPQWCDCCKFNWKEHAEQILGFNPTMVRLLPHPERARYPF